MLAFLIPELWASLSGEMDLPQLLYSAAFHDTCTMAPETHHERQQGLHGTCMYSRSPKSAWHSASLLHIIAILIAHTILGYAQTGAAVLYVDSWGRRPLLLGGVTGMVAALCGLGAASLLLQGAASTWTSVGALLLYVGAYQVEAPNCWNC